MTTEGSKKLGPTSLDFYTHEDLILQRDEIRVLTLEPGSGTTKPICWLEKCVLPVRLSEVDGRDGGGATEQDPEFTALSYEWGDVKKPKAITCNSADFFVTRNLLAALVDVRRTSARRRLWIDAICINQNDDREKKHQLARMGEIYRRATCTIAWLGRPSFLSGWGFEAWNTLSNTMRGRRQENGHESPVRGTILPVRGLLRRLGIGGSITVWNHSIIIPLLRRSYFSRIWIVQEVALSRHLEFVCGGDRVPIDDFILGSINTLASDTGRQHLSTVVNILICRSLLPWAPEDGFEDPAYLLTRLASVRGDTHVDRNLLTLLNLFGGSNATDPVDKIFGLTGLSKEINDEGTWGVDQFYPIRPEHRTGPEGCVSTQPTARALFNVGGHLDHLCRTRNLDQFVWLIRRRLQSSRVEKVFISVARRIVERQRSLQLLGSVCHRDNVHATLWNLPSWVPD